MATTLQLPSPPPTLQGGSACKNTIAAPVERRIEPVGRFFAAHVSRRKHGRTISEDELKRREAEAQAAALRLAALKDQGQEEEEDPSLLALDAQQWKSQDHYQVLGLSRLRYRATFEDVKRACE